VQSLSAYRPQCSYTLATKGFAKAGISYMEVDALEVERKRAGERRAARMAARDEDDE
jgi:hypothetical protein